MLGCQVPLSSIISIDRGKKLYRAKVDDLDLRKRLLDSAKTLKVSPFSYVFINRDLTFQQRKELAERRERSKGHTGSGQTNRTPPQLPTDTQAEAASLN